jgi:sugar transferase EpsL
MFPEHIPFQKRLFDILVTSLGVIILSPVMGVVALFVWIRFGRPVLFNQERGGYRGKVFKMYKFRSMTEKKDKSGNLLPDADRLTNFGRFLRSSSLDELPEFFNILRGEMSLVGPRPLYAHYLERYSPEQSRRHLVLPGLTGWAQINGRNVLTWEEKFQLDTWYVDHWSFWLDIRILAITIKKAIQREGINQPGQATAEEFFPTKENNPNSNYSQIDQPVENNPDLKP